MPLYNFKAIRVVPDAKDFIDIVLSKTQRGTPTVVHNGWAITRIRQFYTRKVSPSPSCSPPPLVMHLVNVSHPVLSVAAILMNNVPYDGSSCLPTCCGLASRHAAWGGCMLKSNLLEEDLQPAPESKVPVLPRRSSLRSRTGTTNCRSSWRSSPRCAPRPIAFL